MDSMVLPLVILAAFLWAIGNFIDKFLISKIAKQGDYRGLIIMSSLVAGVVLLPIPLFLTKGEVITDPIAVFTIFLAAVSYLIALALYFKALRKNDTSLIVAMLNLIPVFGYFFGLIFLNEVLSPHQIFGAIIIIVASIALSFEPGKGHFSKTKLSALLLTCISSAFYAIYYLLFRVATIDRDFNVITFWFQISLIIIGLFLFFFVRRYRKSFTDLITKNGIAAFFLNVFNEGVSIGGSLLVNFAITLAPMAIVQSLNGFQPIFVFLLGFILTTILPRIFKEDRRRRTIIQRTLCILLSFVGLIVLYI